MIRFLATTTLFFTLLVSATAQQLGRFTQFNAVPNLFNPAITGSSDEVDFTLLYRDQWTNVTGGPTTNVASLTTPLQSQKMGIGATTMVQSLGPVEFREFLVSYAYRVRLGPGRLGMGLAFGSRSYRVNLTETDYRDPGEILTNNGNFNTGALDFGLRYETTKWYADLAFKRIDRSSLDIVIDRDVLFTDRSAFAPVTYLSGGYHFEISDKVVVTPQVMLLNDGTSTWYELFTYLNYKELVWVGTGLMRNKGLAVNVQYHIRPRIRLGYAFDQNLNTTGLSAGPSNEIFLKFYLNWFKSKVASPRE